LFADPTFFTKNADEEAGGIILSRVTLGRPMVQVNMALKEVQLKLVYYGPALSGKTTNLQQLHHLLNPAARGKMISLDTLDDRTLYFDCLPVQFGSESGFSIKIKLFTVPGQVMHKSTRKAVLLGADGVVFVADSQRSQASANAYSWRDMEANLQSNGIDFKTTPKVIQFNKRDLPEVKPLDQIYEQWSAFPAVPAVAMKGEGVLETFCALLRALHQSLDLKHDFSKKFGVSEESFLQNLVERFDQEVDVKALAPA